MPIWFSFPIVIVAGGGAAFGTAAWKLTGSEVVAGATCGVMMIVIDSVMRTGSTSNHPAIDPELGGHIYFIPGWVIGILVLIVGAFLRFF